MYYIIKQQIYYVPGHNVCDPVRGTRETAFQPDSIPTQKCICATAALFPI